MGGAERDRDRDRDMDRQTQTDAETRGAGRDPELAKAETQMNRRKGGQREGFLLHDLRNVISQQVRESCLGRLVRQNSSQQELRKGWR